MLVIKKGKTKQLVIGQGLIDSLAKVGNFLMQNKDTIANVSGIAKDVAGAVGSSANAYKEIMEVKNLRKKLKNGNGCKKSKLTRENKQVLNSLAKNGNGFKLVK